MRIFISVSHVVLNEKYALCRGCGDKYDLFPNGKPQELWAFATLAKGFSERHADCAPKTEQEKAALRCALCGEAGHQFEQCNEVHALTKNTWINGYDTGLSSKTIWCFMTGTDFGHLGTWGPQAPADPSDFGRCYRLLLLAPEWRARMPEMATVPGWARIAPAWEELTKLFQRECKRKDDRMPKLFARLGELR